MTDTMTADPEEAKLDDDGEAHLDEQLITFSSKYIEGRSLNLPPGLSFDEWADAGAPVLKVAEDIQFLVGDWDRYGEELFGDDRNQAYPLPGEFGVEPKTISNWCWVAKRIPKADRREGLSWSHHRYAAELDSMNDRRKVLRIAMEDHLSSEDVRKLVQSMKPEEEDAPDRKKKTTITFTQSFTVYTDDEKPARIIADNLAELMERELEERGIEPTKTSRSPI